MRLKEVVYTISNFETTVLTGVFKDVPQKLHKYWQEVCCLRCRGLMRLFMQHAWSAV